MAEKVVRIRVLAIADPSLKSAFVPFEEAARKARARADRTIGQTGRVNNQAGYRSNAYTADERAHADSLARKSKLEERHARYIQDVKIRTFANEQRAQERMDRDAERKRARASSERSKWFGDGARSLGRGALGMAQGGVGAVGDMARGAGIDISLGGMTGRLVSTEQSIIRATNSGLIGKNRIAEKDDIKATTATVDDAAMATRKSRGETATALEAFTSKSSDLEMGKQVLKDLGKIANATGSDFTELAMAAGVVSANMGDVPNKADKITAAMRLMAKQGAMGTVEIKDLATMMPRLAAGANAYGGDYEKNLGDLGAIAQMAMKGGRVSAAEATNTSQSIARDITKKQTLKKFEGAGIDVFTDESKTKMRSVEDVMVDVLKYTKGDQSKLAQLMPNQVSNAAVKSLTDTFLQGEKTGDGGGEKAVRELFAGFRSQTSRDDIERMSGNVENSIGGRAQDFQNKMEGMFGSGFMKAMDGDTAKQLAATMGTEPAMMAMLAGQMGGGGGGAMSDIATITVSTLIVKSMVDESQKQKEKEENDAIAKRTASWNDESDAKRADAPEDLVALYKSLQDKNAAIDAEMADNRQASSFGALSSIVGGGPGVLADFGFLSPKSNTNDALGEARLNNSETMAGIVDKLREMTVKGTVNIGNLGELQGIINQAGPPSVDPGGKPGRIN